MRMFKQFVLLQEGKDFRASNELSVTNILCKSQLVSTMFNNFLEISIDQNQAFIVEFIPFKKKISKEIASPGVITLYVLLLLMSESLGNFLLYCIIWYEKYGMDSQKRTVTNQLLSRLTFVQILFNIFILPLLTIIEIFGPISKYNIFLVWFGLVVWALDSEIQ